MAVEKLVMMNVVGKNEYVDSVIKDIILFENVQIVDAYSEIDNFRFTINVTERNIQEILGFSELESGMKAANSEEFQDRLSLVEEMFGNEFKVDKNYLKKDIELDSVVSSVYRIYAAVHQKYLILKLYYNDLKQIDTSLKAYRYLESADIDMDKINNLENFNYTIGSLSKDSVDRLKRNYGNITAIVVHVGSDTDNEVYLVISPKDLETETNRLLKSLNFSRVEGIKREYPGKPADIIKWLEEKRRYFQSKVDILEKEIEGIKNTVRDESNYAYNVFYLYGKIADVKKEMAFSKDNFYFSGWVPTKKRGQIASILSKYKDIIVIFTDNHDPNIKTPTKLRNNWLFKPFEYLIKMYGIPSYEELDPTPFLSITYMFLFGFMFGDLGQGAIIFIAGVLLMKLKGMEFGKIISRLGISSMFFGLVYGSFFGFETVIPALWLKPFTNINTILSDAVVIGVVFMFIAYAFGIINQFRAKNYYEGVLSKNGITGLTLYVCLLLVVLPLITGDRWVSLQILLGIIALAVVLLFMKEPIIRKLKNKKETVGEKHKSSTGHYIEGFFEIYEIFMGMISNTISFIRVGAFALNHVGLFLAFESMAHLVNSPVASTFIYILGNIFILVLEGLIVGIQVLRLQYYELFSKYFKGGGTEFKPAKL
ncbi:MAG: ATPase [Eubacteriaceae bacterium]|nr:ATPase [Eubacteriaceae bacterium]